MGQMTAAGICSQKNSALGFTQLLPKPAVGNTRGDRETLPLYRKWEHPPAGREQARSDLGSCAFPSLQTSPFLQIFGGRRSAKKETKGSSPHSVGGRQSMVSVTWGLWKALNANVTQKTFEEQTDRATVHRLRRFWGAGQSRPRATPVTGITRPAAACEFLSGTMGTC